MCMYMYMHMHVQGHIYMYIMHMAALSAFRATAHWVASSGGHTVHTIQLHMYNVIQIVHYTILAVLTSTN